MVKGLKFWISKPDGSHEEDNIWSDFHVFDGHWVEVMNREEWYESPNVPTIYKEHKFVFKNIDMGRPFEEEFMQKMHTGEFEVKMWNDQTLPSGKGKLKLTSEISTKSPPDENGFCLVEYFVKLEIKYDMPQGITNLPRILAYPLNKFFKWGFFKFIGEEIVVRDSEYAQQKLLQYMQYIRKYHGEEPLQSKTRESEYKPALEEGRFFE